MLFSQFQIFKIAKNNLGVPRDMLKQIVKNGQQIKIPGQEGYERLNKY